MYGAMSPEQQEAQIIDVPIPLPETILARKYKIKKAKVRHSSAVQQLLYLAHLLLTQQQLLRIVTAAPPPSTFDSSPSTLPSLCGVPGEYVIAHTNPRPPLPPPSPPPHRHLHHTHHTHAHPTLPCWLSISRSLCVADAPHNAVKRPHTVLYLLLRYCHTIPALLHS